MMTIDLRRELEQRLRAEASRQGISTSELAPSLLEEKLRVEGQSGFALPHVLAKTLPVKDLSRETGWLRKHRDEFAGQWVALDGEKPIASGDDLKQVATIARRSGATDALMIRVESSDALPFNGF